MWGESAEPHTGPEFCSRFLQTDCIYAPHTSESRDLDPCEKEVHFSVPLKRVLIKEICECYVFRYLIAC